MSVSSPADQAPRPWSRDGVIADEHDRPVLRRGTRDDLGALTAMHARCSEETLRRRYHGSMPRLTPRVASALLEPADGWSAVAVCGQDAVVGVATYAPDRQGMYDVSLLVEDHWQRQGLGARLLRTLARAAYDHGIPALTCATQPDNACLPRTIRSAGFRPRIRMVDGLAVATFSVSEAFDGARERTRKVGPGATTARGLVPLLAHRRPSVR